MIVAEHTINTPDLMLRDKVITELVMQELALLKERVSRESVFPCDTLNILILELIREDMLIDKGKGFPAFVLGEPMLNQRQDISIESAVSAVSILHVIESSVL